MKSSLLVIVLFSYFIKHTYGGFVINDCEHNDNVQKNTLPCKCGASICWPDSAASQQKDICTAGGECIPPPCVNIDGTEDNITPCQCGGYLGTTCEGSSNRCASATCQSYAEYFLNTMTNTNSQIHGNNVGSGQGRGYPPNNLQEQRLNMYMVMVSAVSYTHLTLPTTPYV